MEHVTPGGLLLGAIFVIVAFLALWRAGRAKKDTLN